MPSYLYIQERGFDILTVFSCPGGTKCKELKRYSDHSLQKLTLNDKTLYYFGSTVRCNAIFANTDELRLRFTSDGPSVKNNDIPSSVLFKGFSAVYISSPSVQTEQAGCPIQNVTLTTAQGSIFAADETQIESTAVTGQSDVQWLQHHQVDMRDVSRYGTTTFKQEYVKRCQSRRGGTCHSFERQESRWWIISPRTAAPQTSQTFAVAFRDLILEDSLDVLTVYARVNGNVNKVNTYSGLSPMRNHEVMKCSKCKTDCRLLSGSSGSVSELATQKTTDVSCTWVITVVPMQYKYVAISASSFSLKPQNRIGIETCMDAMCLSVSSKSEVYGYEGFKLMESSYTSHTGIVRLSFSPSWLERNEGFKLDWKGMCKDPPKHYKKNEDFIEDGWSGDYPEFISCSWIISPENAMNVTVNFTSVALPGLRDRILIEACTTERCQDKILLGNLQQHKGGTFTSQTGMVLITMETYDRSGISAFAEGFRASWTTLKKDAQGHVEGASERQIGMSSTSNRRLPAVLGERAGVQAGQVALLDGHSEVRRLEKAVKTSRRQAQGSNVCHIVTCITCI
jgi:hypothetical protein